MRSHISLALFGLLTVALGLFTSVQISANTQAQDGASQPVAYRGSGRMQF
jgi:hypothetical protein